jgi:hypothetical protein
MRTKRKRVAKIAPYYRLGFAWGLFHDGWLRGLGRRGDVATPALNQWPEKISVSNLEKAACRFATSIITGKAGVLQYHRLFLTE